jgi:hypothetical protein
LWVLTRRAYLAQAKFAAEVNGLDIEFHQLSVYDIAQLGERFNVVPFLSLEDVQFFSFQQGSVEQETATSTLLIQRMTWRMRQRCIGGPW